jgi:hypothetical protein
MKMATVATMARAIPADQVAAATKRIGKEAP